MTREEWLVQYLTEHHKEELEHILADLSEHSIGYDSITWSCGFGSITMTLGKAKELLKPSLPPDVDEAAEEYLDKVFGDGKHQQFYKDLFIAGWECRDEQMPMPEDTVLFQKGVAEGRRLEMEDSVECKVTDVGLNYLDLALFEAERLGLNKGDKVKVIVLKDNEDESK